MKKKQNYKADIERVLHELHVSHPSYDTGRHFSIAFADYGDPWGMGDKEMLFALRKYQAELELDMDGITQSDFVDQIIKDGMNLTSKPDWKDEDNYEDEIDL